MSMFKQKKTEKELKKQEIVVESLSDIQDLINEEIQNIETMLGLIDETISIQNSKNELKNNIEKQLANKHLFPSVRDPLQEICENFEAAQKLTNEESEYKKPLELTLKKLQSYADAIDRLRNGNINENDKILLLTIPKKLDIKNVGKVIKEAIQNQEAETNKDVQSVTPAFCKK